MRSLRLSAIYWIREIDSKELCESSPFRYGLTKWCSQQKMGEQISSLVATADMRCLPLLRTFWVEPPSGSSAKLREVIMCGCWNKGDSSGRPLERSRQVVCSGIRRFILTLLGSSCCRIVRGSLTRHVVRRLAIQSEGDVLKVWEVCRFVGPRCFGSSTLSRHGDIYPQIFHIRQLAREDIVREQVKQVWCLFRGRDQD